MRTIGRLALILVAVLVVLGPTEDGQAQEPTTLTITVEAEGAGTEETFPVHIDFFDGNRIDVDLNAGAPATVELPTGDLAIYANPPAGWFYERLSCTGPEPFVPYDYSPPPGEAITGALELLVPDGANVDCIITNVAVPTGTVRLTETVLGDDPGPAVEHAVLVEQIPAQPLPSGATIDVAVNAGPAFITELPADGFGIYFIDCGENNVLARFSTSVQVEVPVDGIVECTVINVANPVATLTIEKLTNVDADGLTFPFRGGGFDFEITPSRAPGFGGVQLVLGSGPYEFVELPSDGWFLRSLSCSGLGVELLEDGAPGFRVTPVRGGDVDCSFLNESLVGQLGDPNCDGKVDIVDALVIAQFAARIRTEVAQCPLGDVALELYGGAADVDVSGSVDIVDALVIARCSAGLPAILCPGA